MGLRGIVLTPGGPKAFYFGTIERPDLRIFIVITIYLKVNVIAMFLSSVVPRRDLLEILQTMQRVRKGRDHRTSGRGEGRGKKYLSDSTTVSTSHGHRGP